MTTLNKRRWLVPLALAICIVPVQSVCWQALLWVRREMNLPELSNGMGFTIRIGIPTMACVVMGMFFIASMGWLVSSLAQAPQMVVTLWMVGGISLCTVQFFTQWISLGSISTLDGLLFSMCAIAPTIVCAPFGCLFSLALGKRNLAN